MSNTLFPRERYRLTLRHDLIVHENGQQRVHEIDEPICVDYCTERGTGIPGSIVVNEMMERMKAFVLEEMSRAEQTKGERS